MIIHLYIKSQNKLLLFGDQNNQQILCCKIEGSNKQIEYKWNTMNIAKPNDYSFISIQVINVFDTIIILFDFYNEKLFILDLLNKHLSWKLCDNLWSLRFCRQLIIIKAGNFIYFYNLQNCLTQTNTQTWHLTHFKNRKT